MKCEHIVGTSWKDQQGTIHQVCRACSLERQAKTWKELDGVKAGRYIDAFTVRKAHE